MNLISMTPRSRQGAKPAFIIAFFTLLTLFHFSFTHSRTLTHHYHRYKVGSKQVYVEAALSTSVDGPFDDVALKELCANTTWVSGIIFSCTSPRGDVVEMGNSVLNCVRFAIEGGGAFVIPSLIVPDYTFPKESYVEKDFSHLFDTEHLISSLGHACPQMRVYSHINDLYDLPSTSPAVKVTPESLGEHDGNPTLIANMTAWRPALNSFLQTSSPPHSHKHPIRIDLQLPSAAFIFPTSHDPDRLISNFGRLISFRPSARRLAASVLYTLSETFDWRLLPNDGIVAHAFAAFLLPNSNPPQQNHEDKEKSGKTFKKIANKYMNQTLSLGLKVIYLSNNNLEALQLLSSIATPHNISVVTASSLLAGDDLDLLKSFVPEQLALVDHEVFLLASAFGGTEGRLEAWGISLRRHKLSARVDWLKDPVGEGWVMGDEWSVVWSEGTDWGEGGRGGVVRGLWP